MYANDTNNERALFDAVFGNVGNSAATLGKANLKFYESPLAVGFKMYNICELKDYLH